MTKNDTRILMNAARMIYNCVASGQLKKAIEVSKRQTGILKSWRIQRTGGRFNKGKLIKRSKQ